MIDKEFDHIPEKYYGFLYHYYRAEVYRETNWRNRLDATTNWALVVSAAILTFAFSDPAAHHVVILVNYCMVLSLLYAESRRFRYYSLLKKRTRLIEEHLLAPMFSGRPAKQKKDIQWDVELESILRRPTVPMSRIESIAWRLRRNYLFILIVIFFAWLAKLCSYPNQISYPYEVVTRASAWIIPGEVVWGVFVTSIVFFIGIAVFLPSYAKDDDLP